MKELFKNHSVIDYALSIEEQNDGVTEKGFRKRMEQDIINDYEMECVVGGYYETRNYFLLNVTDIFTPLDQWCDMYATFEGENYKMMMVGEFLDGPINERNKEEYLIFRVEAK